ncbi:MAG TPA: aminoglycoside phosphotransferase family protein [Caulobacteraceae bacterium]|nr:aminoglycoside phosphotransferase family protein [Caulobacteraceae bacterium]
MTAPQLSLETLQPVIVRVFPDLASGVFTAQPRGWDSFAIDVDGSLIFKFPRNDAARRRLATEAALLAIVRPGVALPTPEMSLHDGTPYGGPPLFSRHAKLDGEHLEPAAYAALPEADRDRLAEDLARFYAELHALPDARLAAAGAGPIQPWLAPGDILERAWPVLDAPLRRYAERTVAAWRALPPDPFGETYGFFDGHGWNMAFDREAGRLNGVYDFGDSGFGQLQQEFIYANMISPDLAGRIIRRYATLTGRALDAERIALLYQTLRLSELAELAGDPEKGPIALAAVRALAEP